MSDPSLHQVIHMPKRFMGKDYADAREQSVSDYPETAESIAAAKAFQLAERAKIEAARPLVRALRGELPTNTCAACGEPNALHHDTSGFHWIGCDGVPARKHLATLISRPLTFPNQWGDPWPVVSAAIRDGLLAGCGEAVSDFYEQLTPGERLDWSRRLAELAVKSYEASR